MDSIGDNVMAIICVVVGILIIGCALVPIVDNASVVETENVTYEATSGYNTSTDTDKWYAEVDSLQASYTRSPYSSIINGISTVDQTRVVADPITRDAYMTLGKYTDSLGYAYVYVTPVFDDTLDSNKKLVSATIVFDSGLFSITGTDESNNSYSKSVAMTSVAISQAQNLTDIDETEMYDTLTSPFTIGEGQQAVLNSNKNVVITPDSTTVYNGTIVKNEDGTATVTTESAYTGPYKWTGTITHTETITSESEYAGLYNIIPVLCILGMAYVLIRRFY